MLIKNNSSSHSIQNGTQDFDLNVVITNKHNKKKIIIVKIKIERNTPYSTLLSLGSVKIPNN